jgi:heme A synthase
LTGEQMELICEFLHRFAGVFVVVCMLPGMSDQGSDHDQRRDALLLRLLKTPPEPREALAEQVHRAKGSLPGLAFGAPA